MNEYKVIMPNAVIMVMQIEFTRKNRYSLLLIYRQCLKKRELKILKDMSKYQNGKIFKIVDVGYSRCYIGSPCEELSQRMARH